MQTAVLTFILTMLLTTMPIHAAWYSLPNTWFGKSCKEIPYERSDWGFNSSAHRARILKEQAINRAGFIGDTFKDEYSGDIIQLNTFNEFGKKIPNAHVDHVIPLKYMHDNGGCKWNAEQKKKFANDPKNLKLISAYDNTSKGAKSPSQWLPSKAESQRKYLGYWDEVSNKYNAPSFKIKAFKINHPRFVNYTTKITKGAGYTAAAAGLFFSGVGAAAILIPIGVEATDTIIVISEDPDAYFSEVATDFSDAYNTSVEWTSSSWDNTKEWSSGSWSDTSNWTVDSWTNAVKWTGDGWETTKENSAKLMDNLSEQYNKLTSEQ
jgi:hypothetical protein